MTTIVTSKSLPEIKAFIAGLQASSLDKIPPMHQLANPMASFSASQQGVMGQASQFTKRGPAQFGHVYPIVKEETSGETIFSIALPATPFMMIDPEPLVLELIDGVLFQKVQQEVK